MNFAIINDNNLSNEAVAIQLISYSNTTNNKVVVVEKSYLFKALQPGEIEFQTGTALPKSIIVTSNNKEIIKILFEEF